MQIVTVLSGAVTVDSEALLRRNVQVLLQERQLPNAALARHLGKSSPWVSQFLSGRHSVPVKLLTDMATFLGVTPDELFRADRPSAPMEEPLISDKPSTKKRPVFSETAGDMFERLRLHAPNNLRGALTTQRKAALEASRRGIAGLTTNMLWRAENGKIKRPSPDFLRALSTLYGYDYEQVVADISAVMFKITKSSDQIRHTSGLDSATSKESTHVGENPASYSEERLRALEGGLRDMLATVTELLGKSTGARFNDVGPSAAGIPRTRAEEAGTGTRRDVPRARTAGARR